MTNRFRKKVPGRSVEKRCEADIADKRKDAVLVFKRYFSYRTMILGLLVWLAFSLAAAGPTAALGDQTPSSAPLIRSAAEIDYPPFSLVDENGAAGGFSVELMRAALAAMGRTVTFRTGPWADVRGWLEQGEIDALPLVGRTPEREALFDFTVPYMTLHGAIVVRNEQTGIHDLADLRGRRVAVMKGDNAEEFLRREDRGIDIYTTPTFEIALRDLSAGRCDAVVAQRLVALRLIQKTGLTDLRMVDRPIQGFEQDFCFAVQEGDRATLALLNEGLATVVADGTYRHLHAKWFAALQLPSDRPIVVGGDRNFPPFEFIDANGHPAGYNVELTRAIAREMGLNVEIQLGHWPERMAALKDGKIDVMQGMFYSSDRDLEFDFTPAHNVGHYVAVVREGKGPAPETLEALAGKRIVVEGSDIMQDFALEHKLDNQIIAVDDQQEALRELSGGRYDCALVSRITALYLMDKHGWSNLVPAKKPLLAADYCYAVAKGQKALLAQFDEGLKALENSGEYRRIYEKWLGVYQQESPSFFVVLRYSALVIIPLLVILTAAVAWSWTLRRQVAEKTRALQESLDRFQYVFEAANVGKSITLPTGEVNANRAFADYLGYSSDEIKGKKWQDLTFEEDIDATEKVLARLLAGNNDAARFEKRYVHKNGGILWADANVALRRDVDGKPLYFMDTVVDITVRKQAEKARRHSDDRLRLLVNTIPDLVWLKDVDGVYLSCNHTFELFFGAKEADIVGKTDYDFMDEHLADFFREHDRKAMAAGGLNINEEALTFAANGYQGTFETIKTPIFDHQKKMVGVLGIARDITRRKQAEEDLQNNEKKLKWNLRRNELLSETAAQLLQSDNPYTLVRELCLQVLEFIDCQAFFNFLEDPKQDKLRLNACTGISEQEAKKIEWLDHGDAVCGCVAQNRQPMTCEDILDHDDPLTRLLKSFGIQAYCCHPLMIRDRLIGTLSFGSRSRPRFEPEEIELMASMSNLVAVAMNRVETENRLRDSESRFRTFAELAPVGIAISDEEGRNIFFNRSFSDLFGYTLEDLPSVNQWFELAYPDAAKRSSLRETWQKAVEDVRRTHSEFVPAEYPVRCKNGSVRHIEFRMATTGELDIVVFTDITERKKAEADQENLRGQLIQAQKMESVGRLAGGVAHDYNNMLSVIIGFTEFALDKTAPDDPIREDLKEVLEAARRSKDITRQLLAFARRQTIDPVVLDLNETVEAMLKILRRLIGEDIDLSWKPGPGRMPVLMDPSQFDQLLANLCVNARDAIGGVGKLTIETDHVHFDEEYCATHVGFTPGQFVLLAVSDDGSGMDRETLEHLFEPFFSTKRVGEGTGLGLATVFGIVKQNDGFINVYSEPGKGATFRIYLPLQMKADGAVEPREKTDIPLGKGETVLVVEDETSILKLAQMILEGMGYRVLTASTPGAAVALAQKQAGDIHLLITDVVMPEMNGRELAETLQTPHPKLKVLFMSGYTANVIAHRGVLDAGVNFLQKPFSKLQLAEKVRQTLGS